MTLKTLDYLHHHIYLGVGWTAICTQNPGIARKGRGGGVLPLARIFLEDLAMFSKPVSGQFDEDYWGPVWEGVCPLPGFFGGIWQPL